MASDEPSVYLDHNATTPLDPRVRDAMLPWFSELHGNPSSAHRVGRRAKRAVEEAREKIAAMLGGRPSEIVFTSSGSEGNNTVIFTAARRAGEGGHLITTVLEHPSIHAAASRMRQRGMDVTEVTPDANGRIAAATIRQALRTDSRLVCVMLANNELGTVQPIAEISAVCREQGIPVLCDAVQAVGKIPVRVAELGVDYLTLGGHKFHGPPGVAALWIREGAPLESLLLGGAQETGRRASTENVPAIVGLGEAAALAGAEIETRQAHLRALRDRFEAVVAAIPDTAIHCADSERLPHTSHVAFLGLSGYELMLRLDRDGFAVSTGSACHSGQPQPSAALLAMGVSASEALASLRISFGMTNTDDDVEHFVSALVPAVETLRVRTPA